MRRRALAYLVCPKCASSLALGAVTDEAEEHVLEGELVSSACGARFPIRRGVPVLLPEAVDRRSTATAARFDEQWTRWTEMRPYYERQFLGWLAPITRQDFLDRVVFEGGCGKGRHTSLVARFGARDIVAVDLGDSAFVAFENTRQFPNAHVVMGDLTAPPVRHVFDLAFSVGVVHHLPDPALGAAAVAGVVRDGGRVVLWVYGRENNEWIIRFVDPVRKALTSRMPYHALRTLSAAPAGVLWAAIRLLYRPGPDGRGPRHLPYGEYLASMRDFPFDELQLIVFDQLVTPVAHYLPRDEVARWFAGAGFRDVELRPHNQNSWTAVATVKTSAETKSGS